MDVHAKHFDAANGEAVKAVVNEVLDKYGGLDIIFANAGIVGTNKRFDEIKADDFIKTMRTNILSVFVVIKYAAQAIIKTSSGKNYPSGSIIATSSIAGLRSNAG